MTPEVLPVFLHYLMRNSRTIGHAQQTQYRVKRTSQPHDKSAVVRSLKSIDSIDPVMKDPGPAAGSHRIEKPVEAIDDVPRHKPASLPTRERSILVKENIATQMKSPGPAVGRDLPAAGQTGHYP